MNKVSSKTEVLKVFDKALVKRMPGVQRLSNNAIMTGKILNVNDQSNQCDVIVLRNNQVLRNISYSKGINNVNKGDLCTLVSEDPNLRGRVFVTGVYGGTSAKKRSSLDSNGYTVIEIDNGYNIYTKRYDGQTTGSIGSAGQALLQSSQSFPKDVGPKDLNIWVDGFSSDGAGRWKFTIDNYDEDGGSSETFDLYARNMTHATITMTDGVVYVLMIRKD